jgi:hypothetical protein
VEWGAVGWRGANHGKFQNHEKHDFELFSKNSCSGVFFGKHKALEAARNKS